MSSAIAYVHEPHPGFAKSIFRDKGVLMSFQDLASMLRLEFCEEDACLPQPTLGPFTHFTQGAEQLSDGNCFHS